MMTAALSILGWRGILAAVAIVAIPLAYAAGEWRERAATDAKIAAAELAIINSLQEQGHAQAAEAVRAGRRAVDDFDRGDVHDDPHCRDC